MIGGGQGLPGFGWWWVLLLLALYACADSGPAAIPQPDLTRFSPEIRRQIEEARERLEAAARAPELPAKLAAFWGDFGNVCHAYELVAAARVAYGRAGELAPGDPRWPYFLGLLEKEFGEPRAAIGAFERAVELDPERPLLLWALGDALAGQQKLGAARPYFERALARAPGTAPAAVGLAKIEEAENHPERALELLQGALRAQPEANSIHHLMAKIYRRQGDTAAAERHLARAGARQATLADPWQDRLAELRLGSHNRMTLAQQAVRAGRLDEAIAIYRAIVAAEPGHLRAYCNLGAALTRQGDFAAAQAAFESALAIDRADPKTLFNYGTLKLRRGEPGAIELLAASLAADPDQEAARLNLGTALRQAGRHQEALAQFEALVALAPAHDTAHYWQALARLRLARYREARAGLDSALEILPGSTLLQATLARLLAVCPEAALRDGNKALALARTVVAQAPTGENRRTLAMALAESGDFKAAAELVERLLAEAERAAAAPDLRAALREELALYRAGRACRLPWWSPPSRNPAD